MFRRRSVNQCVPTTVMFVHRSLIASADDDLPHLNDRQRENGWNKIRAIAYRKNAAPRIYLDLPLEMLSTLEVKGGPTIPKKSIISKTKAGEVALRFDLTVGLT